MKVSLKTTIKMLLAWAFFLPSFIMAQITPSPAFSEGELVAAPTDGWITNGGSLLNQRYSPLSAINTETITGMKADWRTHLNGSGMGPNHSGQGEALVHEGVLYITTGASDAFALDVENGEKLWSYEANLDSDLVTACCGWVNRGVGLGDGKVFVGRLDAKLVALDQLTGDVLWEIQAEDPRAGYSIASAPRYYNNMVITGFGGGEYGIRGRIKAYDADTGDLIWTFYTVPGPGELGHDTWPQDNDAWKYGGASIWQTPAIDPDLGLVVFSTGNPGPDQNGSVRAGDNLFTVSIVALDVNTGEYRWHFQQTRHDLWDYDSSSPVVLFDVVKDGVMRKGVSQISKSGYLFILDRITGEPLIGMDYQAVPQLDYQNTAATQPIPIGDDVIRHYVDVPPEGWTLVNEGRTYTPIAYETTMYTPNSGANWQPTAYDPETGYLYVCSNENVGGSYMLDLEQVEPIEQEIYSGGSYAAVPRVSSRGIMAAMDVRTNTIVWRQQLASGCSSGMAVTAGGLLFMGRGDGRFTAMNKNNGKGLWSFRTDAGVYPNATIFEHNGEQKVVVLSAGTMFSGTAKSDSVWMFSLNGEIEEVAPGTNLLAITPVEVPDREADLSSGANIYAEICSSCHGDNGQGGHTGGVAFSSALNLQYIMSTASQGRAAMPSFAQTYSQTELHDVASYILQDVVGQ